jgi:site-specific DNA-adenine methylase
MIQVPQYQVYQVPQYQVYQVPQCQMNELDNDLKDIEKWSSLIVKPNEESTMYRLLKEIKTHCGEQWYYGIMLVYKKFYGFNNIYKTNKIWKILKEHMTQKKGLNDETFVMLQSELLKKTEYI